MSPPMAAEDDVLSIALLSLIPCVNPYGITFRFLGDFKFNPFIFPAKDRRFISNPKGKFAQYAVSDRLLMLR